MTKWLTTKEVAAALQVPEQTVRWWRHSGKGPRGARVGKGVRYREDEVERWMREREDADAAERAGRRAS